MPQLDKLTFFTQYFWLTVFFFILYFFMVNFFVHTIFTVGKLYKQVNQFWSSFLANFNPPAFDELMSKRYLGYIINSSILILIYHLTTIKFNYLNKLLKK